MLEGKDDDNKIFVRKVVNAFLGRNFNVSDNIFGLENVEWHLLASYMSCII